MFQNSWPSNPLVPFSKLNHFQKICFFDFETHPISIGVLFLSGRGPSLNMRRCVFFFHACIVGGAVAAHKSRCTKELHFEWSKWSFYVGPGGDSMILVPFPSDFRP